MTSNARRGNRRHAWLDRQLDKRPKQLSGGQRQRVASVAPSSSSQRSSSRTNRSPTWTQSCATNAGAHPRPSRRIGHDHGVRDPRPIEAMTLADRIAVLDGGVLQQHGAPMDVYRTLPTILSEASCALIWTTWSARPTACSEVTRNEPLSRARACAADLRLRLRLRRCCKVEADGSTTVRQRAQPRLRMERQREQRQRPRRMG